jgi:hypothetical protein
MDFRSARMDVCYDNGDSPIDCNHDEDII